MVTVILLQCILNFLFIKMIWNCNKRIDLLMKQEEKNYKAIKVLHEMFGHQNEFNKAIAKEIRHDKNI